MAFEGVHFAYPSRPDVPVLRVVDGDWRAAGRVYRAWFEKTFGISKPADSWIRRQSFFQMTMFELPEGTILDALRFGYDVCREVVEMTEELVRDCGVTARFFEALLRGKTVVCHGQPFYAGWGLTTDRVATERRGRGLSLDELVAGTLLLYPVYVSRVSGRFTTAERALEELLSWRAESMTPQTPWSRFRHWSLRRALAAYARLVD